MKKYIIVLLGCLLFISGIFAYIFVSSKNSNIISNTANEEIESEPVVKETERDRILKKGDIAFKDDNYLVYRGDAFQFGDVLLIYDKNNDSYVNDLLTIDDIITVFKKIDDVYYAFGPNVVDRVVDVYNVTDNKMVRQIEGMSITFEKDLAIIDPGFPVVPTYKRVWSATLEKSDIYANQTKNIYNSDNTITVQKDNTIYVLNEDGKILKQKEYKEVLDIYVDYVFVADEKENYFIYNQYGVLAKTLSIEDIDKIDTIILELQS